MGLLTQRAMSSMSGRVFVDTNILIYAYDLQAGQKHDVANAVVRQLWQTESGVVSPQVLQEFYFNITRKRVQALSKAQARLFVADYFVWCIPTTASEVAAALRIEEEARISFWDALICASGAKAGASRILSEDLNHGQTIAGIVVENPFLSAAPLAG